MTHRLCRAVVAVVIGGVLLAACGDDDTAGDTDSTEPSGDTTVRLLTHDSFLLSDGVLDAFTDETGIEVEVIQGERIDLVAYRTLGDPLAYWRICDANNAMDPQELTEEPGFRLRVPLPQA